MSLHLNFWGNKFEGVKDDLDVLTKAWLAGDFCEIDKRLEKLKRLAAIYFEEWQTIIKYGK